MIRLKFGDGGILRGVVGRDQAADGHAAVDLQPVADRDHDVAADVLEIQVDAVRGQPVQRLADVLVLVVDGGVEPELLGQPAAFVGAAGDADDAARRAPWRPGRRSSRPRPAAAEMTRVSPALALSTSVTPK